jgi:hypothetical protein
MRIGYFFGFFLFFCLFVSVLLLHMPTKYHQSTPGVCVQLENLQSYESGGNENLKLFGSESN